MNHLRLMMWEWSRSQLYRYTVAPGDGVAVVHEVEHWHGRTMSGQRLIVSLFLHLGKGSALCFSLSILTGHSDTGLD